MKFNVSAKCDIGCVRNNNEDKILLPGTVFTNDSFDITFDTAQYAAFAVADGMGGHNAGEVASDIVLKELYNFIVSLDSGHSFESFNNEINQWANKVHSQLKSLGEQKAELKGMGTTLTGLFYYYKKFFWFNAGDSRLYRYRNGILRQISRDHSLAEATGNKDVPSNILVNSIGGGSNTYIEMEEITTKVFTGDKFLICSDGLTDMITDETIENLLNEGKNALDMVEEAKKNGGRDNISVIIIECIF